MGYIPLLTGNLAKYWISAFTNEFRVEFRLNKKWTTPWTQTEIKGNHTRETKCERWRCCLVFEWMLAGVVFYTSGSLALAVVFVDGYRASICRSAFGLCGLTISIHNSSCLVTENTELYQQYGLSVYIWVNWFSEFRTKKTKKREQYFTPEKYVF